MKWGLTAALLLVLAVPAAAPARPDLPPTIELVVTLAGPALADLQPRSLAAADGRRRLDLRTTQSRAYLRRLESTQRRLANRIEAAISGSAVRWRYSVVLNGMAVVIPRDAESRLARVPGIAKVWPNRRYRPLLNRTPALIGATKLWGPGLASAGNGIKIGIVDDGIDQSHPFFNPTGYTYPAGFPKGNTAYATPKVIVARAFAPANATYRYARVPYDPRESEHATHVAGIAAGNANTAAEGVRVSGIAPRAYLGNYKALSIPTPGFGLDGNAPELAAAVEAAVRDGMDVINLSLGEPEVEPGRDVVVASLNAAADAGVVPVVAAGNDFADFGSGSIGSPGNTPKAISVAASSVGGALSKADQIASFSSGGPTPYSLQMKPDVTAPGVQVLSSVPARAGSWANFSGTSMAAPHVAGGAALLRQRHPTWTVAQIKSALVLTGVPVRSDEREVPAMRQGGGRIDLVRADNPLLFATPTSVSFGLLRPGSTASRAVALTDAGGGAGAWTARVEQQSGGGVSVPGAVTVPGNLPLSVRLPANAPERDATGFVVIARGATERRLPYWFRVERPRLAGVRARALTRPGTHVSSTFGARRRVAHYRYPDLQPTSVPFPVRLAGPEVAYRFRLGRPAANFGVAVATRGAGVRVQPRIVRGADENRLAGYTALPLDLNPYRSSFGTVRLVAGVILPAPDTYTVVFDSPAGSRRGRFTFRFWIGDTRPPALRVLSVRGGTIVLAVRDGGSGVDPRSLRATVDGASRGISYSRGVARIFGVGSGRHTLVVRAADYQETKNMEDVGPILPNTRTLRTRVVVR